MYAKFQQKTIAISNHGRMLRDDDMPKVAIDGAKPKYPLPRKKKGHREHKR